MNVFCTQMQALRFFMFDSPVDVLILCTWTVKICRQYQLTFFFNQRSVHQTLCSGCVLKHNSFLYKQMNNYWFDGQCKNE